MPWGEGFLFSFTPARRRWTSSALTHAEKEQISMEHVTESVRMHEYVEPETTPVASRVFDEMVRVRGVSQNMEPILHFLNQNVEIVDLMLLERISAGFYTHPIHVPISNTSDTTPLTGPVALELFVADSVTLAGGTNEGLRLTRSHQDGTVVTVDVPVPQNLEGRFVESTQEFIIEQIGDQIVDLPVLHIMPEIIDVPSVTCAALSSRVEFVASAPAPADTFAAPAPCDRTCDTCS